MSEEPQSTPLRLNAQPSQDGGPAGSSQGAPSPASADSTADEANKAAASPLRLKLRPRSPSAEPPATIPPTPVPPATIPPTPEPADSTTGRIRLKPRLIAEPETKVEQPAAAEPAASPSPAPAPVPILFKTDEPSEPPATIPPATIPPATIPPAPAPAATAPMMEPPSTPPAPIPFKPKLKVPGSESTPSPSVPFPAAAPESPPIEKSVPPFLVVPQTARPASNPPFVVGQPKVPHIRGPEGQVEIPEPPPAVEPVKRTGFKIGVAVAAVLAAIIVVAAGYALMKVFTPEPPPPKPVAAARRPTPTKPATTQAKPSTAPTTVGQVQSLITASQRAEQARVDALASGREPADTSVTQSGIQWAPTAATTTPAQSSTAAKPATPPPTAIAQPPPPPAEVVRVAAPPKASAAFRRFVADASIPGVFQGNPARALINGRTVQAGEIADRNLGITFVGIDAEKKTITFRDGTGAEVTRSY